MNNFQFLSLFPIKTNNNVNAINKNVTFIGISDYFSSTFVVPIKKVKYFL